MPTLRFPDPSVGLSPAVTDRELGAPSGAQGTTSAPGSGPFTLARVFLLIILFGAPLAFGAVQPWAWASVAAGCFLAVLLWGVGCVRQRTVKIYWCPLFLPAALFLVLGVVQHFAHWTFDAIASRESLLKLATDLSFFFLAVQLVGAARGRVRQGVGLAVAIYTFLLSLLAIIQFFSSPDRIYWSVPLPGASWCSGPYVNHNHFAGLLEMLIPLVMGYCLTLRKGDTLRLLLSLPLLLPLVALILTASRGGLVALCAEAIILGVVLFKLSRSRDRRPVRLLPALGAIAVLLAGCVWLVPGDNLLRLETLVRLRPAKESSFGNRSEVAMDSLRILRDHPWAGIGLGSFKSVYARYQSFPDDALWDHAHNDYAEALAETGLPGGLLIAGAFLIFLRLAFNRLFDRVAQGSGWLAFGATLGCCGLLVHSLFDFNLHLPANALWFAFCAALATSDRSLESPEISG